MIGLDNDAEAGTVCIEVNQEHTENLSEPSNKLLDKTDENYQRIQDQ